MSQCIELSRSFSRPVMRGRVLSHHGFVETGKVGSGIDRLYLNSEGPYSSRSQKGKRNLVPAVVVLKCSRNVLRVIR